MNRAATCPNFLHLLWSPSGPWCWFSVIIASAFAAGSTVVAVADDAVNMAVVATCSLAVTVIFRRACRHACHVILHDHVCRYDDLPIPPIDLPGSTLNQWAGHVRLHHRVAFRAPPR